MAKNPLAKATEDLINAAEEKGADRKKFKRALLLFLMENFSKEVIVDVMLAFSPQMLDSVSKTSPPSRLLDTDIALHPVLNEVLYGQGLDTRIENQCRAEGMERTGDLVVRSSKIPNLGRRSYQKIDDLLAVRGLKRGMDVLGWQSKPLQSGSPT
ncbi:MAG: hypothetical protein JWN37_569 [Candidatus Nomurabacteria bacterium]|nr:hypothetical protein [Candidatus Nomurabacteria bacterium]